MDKEHADFQKVYSQIREKCGNKAVALELPIGEGEEFRGAIDLLGDKACIFKSGTTKGEFTEEAIPEDMAGEVSKAKEMLVELAAEADDALIEKYLEEGELDKGRGHKRAHKAGKKR